MLDLNQIDGMAAHLRRADEASRTIVVRQFNSITAENVMKAEVVNPQPGVFEFGPADAFVAFVDGLALDRVVAPERNARISFDVFWLAMLGLTD